MSGRIGAVCVFLFCADLFSAHAAVVSSVRTQAGPQNGPTVIAPLDPLTGPSLSGSLGPIDVKGTLSDLPGTPGVTPESAKTGAAAVPALLESLGLPAGKVGFRPDEAPPALPASAIPNAASPAAQPVLTQWELNPAGPAAGINIIETFADFNLRSGTLKPGPGGELPAMKRQSLAIAAKAAAVAAQTRVAAEAGAGSDDGSLGLGRRVMDILTGEQGQDSPKTDARPDAGGFQDVASRLALEAAVRSYGAWRGYGVPRLAAHDPARGPLDIQASALPRGVPPPALPSPREDAARSPRGLEFPDGIALIALQVYRQSIYLYTVGAPGPGLAMRLARSAASSLARTQGGGKSLAALTIPSETLRDAVASPRADAPAWGAAPLSGYGYPSVQAEAFSFMQSAGDRLDAASASPDGDAPSFTGRPGPDGADASRIPAEAPLLAAVFLPFVGLSLVLRSRLFS